MTNAYSQYRSYNNELFKKYLPIYDFSEILLHSIRKSIAQQLPRNASTLLDVACGTGTQLLELAKRGHRVTGIDLSPDMLGKAKKKLQGYSNTSLRCGDATHMPFPNNTFDASLISFSLHDMPEDVGIAILQEMKRVTKKGGEIVLVDYVTHKKNPMSLLTHRVARSWESKYYPDFVQKGLRYYMEKADLIPVIQRIYFRGIAELYICNNN